MEFFLRVFHFLVLFCAISGQPCSPSAPICNHFNWTDILYCPDDCINNHFGYGTTDECCTCLAKPCWDIENIDTKAICGVTKLKLYIEYTDIHGGSHVMNQSSTDLYELVQTNGRMTSFPTNICDFADSLVKLDLTQNLIKDIDDLSCLRVVDTIHLDMNRVRHISNRTFANMTRLRVLTLTHNKIEHLEPNVLKMAQNNIYFIDLNNNRMQTVDITNVIRPGPFCLLNLSHSEVEKFTNELNYMVDKTLMHGPGDVDVQFSKLSSYVNFSSIGIAFNELPNYFGGKIKIDSSSVACDCGLYPLFTGLGDEVGKFWPNLDGQNFVCNNPERMRNVSLKEILDKKLFEQLTCDLQNCPHYGICHCLDIPNDNKIIVNCTNADLKHFPDEMPVGYWNNVNVDLILVNNNIREIPDRDYMDRLVALDLRENVILSVNSMALEAIQKDSPINMQDQRLFHLIKAFFNKDPLAIHFGASPVMCDCSNLWVGDWARSTNKHSDLMCQLDGGHVLLASDTTSVLLECGVKILLTADIVAPIGAFLSLFLLTTGLYFTFKYDLMIAFRRLRRSSSDVLPLYDLFISLCDGNSDAFDFVDLYLQPALNDAAYSMFIPWFHLDYGRDRDEQVAGVLEQCKTFIVVLCSSYLEEYNTRFEFDQIWERYKSDNTTQIIVINLDHLSGNDLTDKRMRALRRNKADISFRDRRGKLTDRLIARIGPPARNERPASETKKAGTQDDNNKGDTNPGKTDTSNNAAMTKYFSLPVHERLNIPRPTFCKCKYRKCYLHDGALDLPHVDV